MNSLRVIQGRSVAGVSRSLTRHHAQHVPQRLNFTQWPAQRRVWAHAEPQVRPDGEPEDSALRGQGGPKASQQLGRDDLNKVPIALTMTPDVYTYLLDHTREHAALAALRVETTGIMGAHMQITPEQGALLAVLAELVNTKRAVEVGVFTGYSALSVALVLPEDGMLVALDKDERTMAVARKYFDLAGVGHKVQSILGPAQDSLKQLLQQYGPNSFDFAFIDADKRAYDAYYEILLQLVRPGGLIVADNIFMYGRVADPDAPDKASRALRDFNDKLLSDPRISLSIIPVGDGVALCRKRG